LDDIEARLMKVEYAIDNLSEKYAGLTAIVNKNSALLQIILSNTESLDKILKYVVTPLILILGGLVGVKVVLPI